MEKPIEVFLEEHEVHDIGYVETGVVNYGKVYARADNQNNLLELKNTDVGYEDAELRLVCFSCANYPRVELPYSEVEWV